MARRKPKKAARRKGSALPAKPAKTMGKTTPRGSPRSSSPAKVPQPHGGALNSGGTPGNAGGTGRPPSVIRAAMRERLDTQVLDVMHAEWMADTITTGDYGDFLAKYGLGTTRELTVDHVRSRLEETYRILFAELDEVTFTRVDARLAPVWR